MDAKARAHDGDADSEIDFQEALLKKAKQGYIPAFEKLILQYEKLIYNIAYRMFGNQEDARDLSQETLIKIYKNIGKCVDIRHFKSWLYTVTGNTCIDELRRRKGKTTDSIDEDLEFSEGNVKKQMRSGDKTPEESYLNNELGETLQKAIGRLSPDKRRLVILRDIRGLSYAELSEITDTSMGTVKSKLARARGELKDILTKLKEQNKL
ncbi:MAG: RNA polymerase sigma factor [Clostridiales bacterium]|jgi:RNA polymerase sigma-70 factor (ECF subfamily)|nr:RNA polymerase sigma factor [Clostridiales bacterium]